MVSSAVLSGLRTFTCDVSGFAVADFFNGCLVGRSAGVFRRPAFGVSDGAAGLFKGSCFYGVIHSRAAVQSKRSSSIDGLRGHDESSLRSGPLSLVSVLAN